VILFLKNLLFTLLVPGTVAFYLPVWVASWSGGRLGGPLTLNRAVALVPILAGAATYFWCLYWFVRDGRATPFPLDPPKVLVVHGPYRYVRNPMYVGVCIALVGWWLWFQRVDLLWLPAIYFAIVALFVNLYEEPTLRRLFGAQYDRYRATVGAWIPGRPWSGD